jgi:uncharacterized membrane protein
MNKMMVAVFDSETQAYEGLSALKSLHSDGSITVYATAVVVKDAEGKTEVKDAADDGPLGTAVGLFTGSLIGLLAGPVGLAVGAGLGTMTGAIYDVNKSGIDMNFMNDVSEALTPGKVAVLADVEETWTTPVDSRLHEFGALVFRRNRSEVEDDQLARESAELDAEMKELKEEFKEARDNTKDSIQKQIDHVKEKMYAISDRTQNRISHGKEELDAKVSALQVQMTQASEHKKQKLQKRMAELQADYEERKTKLDEARGLITNALS